MIRGGAVILRVSDVGRAVRFYVETLGMKLVSDATETSAVLDAGEGFHIGLERSAAPAPPSAPVLLYAKVPLEEAIAIYENRGVTFDVARTAEGVVARFFDLDANALALVSAWPHGA